MLLYSRGGWILLKDYRGEYKYKIIENQLLSLQNAPLVSFFVEDNLVRGS